MTDPVPYENLQFNGMTVSDGVIELEESLLTYLDTYAPVTDTLELAKEKVRTSGDFFSLTDYMDDPLELVPFYQTLTPAMELESDLPFFTWATKVKDQWVNGL